MSQLSANFATINLQLDQKRLFSTTPLQLERTKNKQKKHKNRSMYQKQMYESQRKNKAQNCTKRKDQILFKNKEF